MGSEEAERLLSLLNEPPRFFIRINLSRISKEEVMEELEAKGIKTTEGTLLPSALHVDRLAPVLNLRIFKEGAITIQDEASQLVAEALAPGEGDRILDACAGLGTKTMQVQGILPDLARRGYGQG